MKIYVRRRHIDGAGRMLGECPIEMAIRDAIGMQVLITGTGFPRSVKRFISNFDAGKPVKPFAFTIK